MARRVTTVFILLAFLNLTFAGCTKTVKLQLHEVGSMTHEEITAVVLQSDQAIVFNELGGRYHPSTKLVTGITEAGERFQSNLGDLKYVRVVDLAAADPLAIAIEARGFRKTYQNHRSRDIIEVITRQGDVLKFDKQGGRLNQASKTVVGIAKDGSAVEVAFADVDYVRVKKPDVLKNVLLLVVTVFLVYSIATFDPLDDWNWSDSDDTWTI